jgi:SAM-dependent methyltransferase
MKILEHPSIYHSYQLLGGFFRARLKAFHEFIDFSKVGKIIDIGCGPGHIISYIPDHVEYIGVDTDRKYIEFAQSRFGTRGKFICDNFSPNLVQKVGTPDLILMNGVLHHMDNSIAVDVIGHAKDCLSDGGIFLSLDGCYSKYQNYIAQYLLKHDRGQYVRYHFDYKDLVENQFGNAEVFVRSNYSWVPYTFAIVRAIK